MDNLKETNCSCDKKMKRSNLETKETWTNMVLRSLLRPARYFDPPVSCYSCGEEGHTASNCPNPTEPRRKPCFRCASYEHVRKQCPMKHRDKDCPDDASTETDISCLRCGGFGHDMFLCKFKYSKDDLKDIQCYVCKSYGHLSCVKPCHSSKSSSWAKSCYRCGKRGHAGLTCFKKRHISSDLDRIIHTERKRKRRAKNLARALSMLAEIEEKKQRKLEEQQRLDSDDRVMVCEEKGFKIDLFTNYVPWQSCGSYADCETSTPTPSSLVSGKENDGNSEQHSTLVASIKLLTMNGGSLN